VFSRYVTPVSRVQGVAFIPGRWPAMAVQGPAALAMGIGCLAVGILAHFHWFWSVHPRFITVGQIGKIITLSTVAVRFLDVFFSGWVG